MREQEPTRIQLEMTGGRPFYHREVLAAVVGALAADPLFAPQTWGLDARSAFPFDARKVASAAEGSPSFYMLQLRRKKRIRHDSLVHLSDKPGLVVEPPPKTPPADRRHLFDLGDALAAAYQPDIGWAHIFVRPGPDVDEDAATNKLMDASVVGSGLEYDESGPGGLGLRTYLGPRVVEAVGRQLLLSTPAHVTELSWGGVRLDLAAEPWDAVRGELLAAWRAATEHLRPARVFSEARLDERGIARVTRGERFDPRAHRP